MNRNKELKRIKPVIKLKHLGNELKQDNTLSRLCIILLMVVVINLVAAFFFYDNLSYVSVAGAGVSFLLFLLAIYYAVKDFKRKRNKPMNQRLINSMLLLILSIWAIKYAVGVTATNEYINNYESLNLFDHMLNSFVHALQTYSMDEGYTEYVVAGKAFFLTFGKPYSIAYAVYIGLLNIVAPIAGGAIVLDLLSDVFPKIDFLWRSSRCKKFKYIFSELNERSICLAENLYEIHHKLIDLPADADITISERYGQKGYLIIFTDVGGEDMTNSRLMERARRICAVCLSDNICDAVVKEARQNEYYLINQDAITNINMMMELTSEDSMMLKYQQSEILLFSNDPGTDAIVKNRLKYDTHHLNMLHNITIRIIKDYKNLIYNLLSDIPLYKPLLTKKDRSRLHITILGSGEIGTEMFLASYWCGQFKDCQLKITVISENAENEFIQRIMQTCPEALPCSCVGHPMLWIHGDSHETNAIYCEFEFINANVVTIEFDKALEGDGQSTPIESDYFLVALGSDEVNIAVAEKLKLKIKKYNLVKQVEGTPVIAYVVYDTQLCNSLNEYKEQDTTVQMTAFGSLANRYSYTNIFMSQFIKIARGIKYSYNRNEMENFKKNEYSWWSDIARAVNTQYKRYHAGLTYSGNDKFDTLKERYEYQMKLQADSKLCDELSWLEHRRWNAYMRSNGFSYATRLQFLAYAGKEGNDHKNLTLKLHPCLVECLPDGMHEIPWEDELVQGRGFDLLDQASLDIYHMKAGQKKLDYKKYDYPRYDQSEYAIEEVAGYLGCKYEEIPKLQEKIGKLANEGGMFYLDTIDEWRESNHV